jgi:transposase
MFGLSLATRIYVGVEAIDMRKGFDGLYGLVKDYLGQDPLSGHLFLFTNRTKTRVKALVWDGSGLWVCAKRLERGQFHWPAGSARATGRPNKKRHNASRRACNVAQRVRSEANAAPQELVRENPCGLRNVSSISLRTRAEKVRFC